MKKIKGCVIFSLILACSYIIGILKFLSENEEDRCEMTYMFEYPQYVKISNKADKEFRKYGLYAYSEGRLTERTRNMYFDGIPVLFIPGNAGSHKQVRSLSSVALRKWLNSRTPFHFDYFTVDLNEEYSGLYGPLLFDQLRYVNASLHRILELYEDRQQPPESVVVVGHSMGGIIAMKLLSELEKPDLVSVVITLASPLKRPVLSLDYHMNKFYEGIFDMDISATTVVSLGGGYKDILMHPHLTKREHNGIVQAATSHIPISWTESNHVQILWCKQVVMALNRALFDSVDMKTRQISTNATYRNMAFKHHLVKNSGIKVRNHDQYSKLATINTKGKWVENIRKTYTIEHPRGLDETQWNMITLSDVPGYEVLTILAVNLEVTDWVFACNAYYVKQSTRVCPEGFHLSQKSEIAPSVKYKRRMFHINMKTLKRYRNDLSHIIFKAQPTKEPVKFHVDIHGSGERNLTVNLPAIFSFSKQIIVERTVENAVYYELALPTLKNIIQYYRVFLEPIECKNSEHHASITLTTPWSNENYHGFTTNTMKKPFNLRLSSSKPSDGNNSTAALKIILDPFCTYKISVQSSLFGVLGQLARIYTPLMAANLAAIALMALRHQLMTLKDGYCSIIFTAIQEGAKPFFVFSAYVILTRLLSLPFLPALLLKPDHIHLVNDGVDFFVIPLFLYICSIGFFWMLVAIFSVSLIAMESTVHKLSLKLLARTVSFNMAWSDYLMGYLHKVPVVVALTLISLSLTTCGGLALCLGAMFYFLRLTQMSQDFVEEVVWFIGKKIARKLKRFLSRKKNTPENQRAVILSEETNTDEKSGPSNLKPIKEVPENDSDADSTEKLLDSEETDVELETDLIDDSTKVVEDSSERNKMVQVQCELKDEETETNTEFGVQVKLDENNGFASDAATSKTIIESNVYTGVNEIKGSSSKPEPSKVDDHLAKNLNQCSNTNETEESSNLDRQLLELSPQAVVKHETSANNASESNRKERSRDPELSSAYNAIFFHSTLFFLWCIITAINIPAVLTWAHNFKYNTILEADDSFIPGFTLSISALILWQCEFPKTNRKWMDELQKFVLLMAILCLVFASLSIYRISYILMLTIVVVALHQVLAPIADESISEEDEDEKTRYADLKAKME